MHVRQGTSQTGDSATAVAEATATWPQAPQMIISFSSSKLDPEGVARALATRFPGTPLAGCTTAGEQLGREHHHGSLAVVGVWDSSIRWAVTAVRGLGAFDEQAAIAAIDLMLKELGTDREMLEPNDHFAMLLIDGLSMAEERITELLGRALEGVPLAGGSAGDDLAFERTQVYTEEGAFSDGAVLVLASKGNAKVEVIKHQHFTTTPKALCITKADPGQRVVHELDGFPAADAYAEALGLSRDKLTPDIAALHPITFSVNGEIFVRSIQSIRDDGAMVLYCGIEEGMVLEIGSHTDMLVALRATMDGFKTSFGRADLIVGFNCILRALEAGKDDRTADLGSILAENSGSLIGFDTYGEQLNGMHINQTLVALAMSEPDRD